MVVFITVAAALAAITALLLVRPMLGGGQAQTSDNRDAADAELYRDQLAELDRDLERGVISASEADGAKAEIARRLIASAKRAEAAGTPDHAPADLSRKVAIGSLLAAPAVGAVLYLGVGWPGLENKPLAERNLLAEARDARLPQAEAEAQARLADTAGPRLPDGEDPQYAALVTRLEEIVAGRPNDVEGHRLLATAFLRQGRYAKAWPVLDRLIVLEGGEQAPADLHAAKGEAMILAAGGYVTPEAEDALAQALRLEPGLPVARYYAGHALAQVGQVQQALNLWQRLALEASPDEPWLPALQQILAEAARDGQGGPLGGMAGLTPPDQGGPLAPPGVDPDAAAAVAAMSPEERMAFMVGRIEALEARLMGEGGGPDEWAQLVRAYDRLGRDDDARRAYRLSQEKLSGSEAGFVREQALVLGVIDE
ncbi:MAG: c-type cytochrome biogenesis protein CcmI [Pseudomonadota bacterium]